MFADGVGLKPLQMPGTTRSPAMALGWFHERDSGISFQQTQQSQASLFPTFYNPYILNAVTRYFALYRHL
jgi:hypothetical protein